MSFLRRRPVEPENRDMLPFFNLAGVPGLLSSSAYGEVLSVEKALKNAASYACIDVLADAVARVPLYAVRGEGVYANHVSPQPSVLTNPSGITRPSVFRYAQAFSMVTDGNQFARILSMSSLGYPTQMELLDPTAIMQRGVNNGIPRVMVDNKWENLYPFGDIWHVPGRTVRPGSPFAVSPVVIASKVIGTSLSVEDFSFDFFNNGAHPSAIIYAEQTLSKEQATSIKDAAKAAMTGRDVGVFGAGLKYERIQTPPGETQFLDMAKFAIEQTCRFWRVPPVLVYSVMSGQNVTYVAAGEGDLQFLKHTLDSYLLRLEEAYTDLLPKPQTVAADRNAVLRMDQSSAIANEVAATGAGLKSIDEGRFALGLKPLGDGYDKPRTPVAGVSGAKPELPSKALAIEAQSGG